MTERTRAMDEAELRVTGIDALNKALGSCRSTKISSPLPQCANRLR
jgi:hypothetical protein